MYVTKKSRQIHQTSSFFLKNYVKISISIFGKLISKKSYYRNGSLILSLQMRTRIAFILIFSSQPNCEQIEGSVGEFGNDELSARLCQTVVYEPIETYTVGQECAIARVEDWFCL